MVLTDSDRQEIRDGMVGPVSDRMSRVEKQVDTMAADMKQIGENQATINANMQTFLRGLEKESEERKRSEDQCEKAHAELFSQTRKAVDKISAVELSSKVGDASAKGLAVGAVKAVAMIGTVLGIVVAALGIAHKMGWLGMP